MATLLELAREAALRAYIPYSHFPVGAAVETDKGIFVGCNIENASYGLTVCAERVALWKAVSEGATRIERMAVSCIEAQQNAPLESRMPCGACRQVMAEFLAPEAEIEIDGVGIVPLKELLPKPFLLERPSFVSLDTSEKAVRRHG